MSGRLRILKPSTFVNKKHDHFILKTKKNILIFNDARRFGFIDLFRTKKISKKHYISRLGLDALDRKLNERYFRDKICKSIVPIKQILLNQEIVAGIGNIYANEILYDAKISPFTKGCSLTILEIKKIIKSIKKILRIAINSGGSTLMVGQGDPDDASGLLQDAMSAPLANLSLDGAKACLLQIEGGPGMTVGQVGLIADAFTARFDEDAQVILGARVSDDLQGRIRVVAVVAGLEEKSNLSLI